MKLCELRLTAIASHLAGFVGEGTVSQVRLTGQVWVRAQACQIRIGQPCSAPSLPGVARNRWRSVGTARREHTRPARTKWPCSSPPRRDSSCRRSGRNGTLRSHQGPRAGLAAESSNSCAAGTRAYFDDAEQRGPASSPLWSPHRRRTADSVHAPLPLSARSRGLAGARQGATPRRSAQTAVVPNGQGQKG